VSSTSVSVGAALTDIVTLNFNGSSTAASVLTTLTTATMIDTLNIVSTGSFATANSIGTFNALATNATVNVSGAQAFTATLPNLGTGTFNGANATGKLTITTGAVATTVVGGSAADVITGGSASTSLTGGAGNDTIVGGTAADTITGGLGADSMTGGITGLNTFVFAAGDSLSTGRDTLVDLKEGDIIKFGTALTGLTNATTLSTSSASAIYVDATNNRLVVGNDQITIPASVANAAYTYSSGTDAIVGTIDDTITVGAAPFNASNNGLGKLTLTGKSASTVAVVINAATPATVNGSSTLNTTNLSTVNTLDASGLTTSGVTVTQGTAAENITGSAQDDTFAFAASLTLADTVNGGLGSDTLTFTTVAAATALNLVTNVEIITASGDNAVSLTTVDALVASGATLTVSGAALTTNTNVFTWNGAAELDGKFVLTGGAGSDAITGGAGADTITGGAGADTLAGGTGADTFVYTTASNSNAVTAAVTDTITGLVLNGASGDLLDFTWTGTLSVLSGTSAAANYAAMDTTAEITSLFNSTNGTDTALKFTAGNNATAVLVTAADATKLLVVDVNGDGAFTSADVAIVVTGVTATSFTTACFV